MSFSLCRYWFATIALGFALQAFVKLKKDETQNRNAFEMGSSTGSTSSSARLRFTRAISNTREEVAEFKFVPTEMGIRLIFAH